MTAIPTTKLKGYVTIFSAVTGQSHGELERRLGFGAGRLSNGYRAFQLSEPIGPDDFEWKDRTRYSGGWHYDPSIGEYVQRTDELRAHLGKKYGYDEKVVDRRIQDFRAAQLKRLNVRSGPNRVVKIIPNDPGTSFPDSPFEGIPQWNLTREKQFTFIGDNV